MKTKLKIFILCFTMLATACCISTSTVYALSEEGSQLIDSLTSAIGGIGGSIGNLIPTTEEKTTQSAGDIQDAEDALGDIFQQIGFGSDILEITDLIAYLNRGGSFADWIYDNYGDNIEIPDSVQNMATGDLVMYLMSNLLYPDKTTAPKETTTPKYVYNPGKNDKETTTKTVYTTVSTTLKEPSYKTGDVNDDGKVNAIDARTALRAGAQLEILTGKAFDAADVNGDGRVTAQDARSILRFSAQITNGF